MCVEQINRSLPPVTLLAAHHYKPTQDCMASLSAPGGASKLLLSHALVLMVGYNSTSHIRLLYTPANKKGTMFYRERAESFVLGRLEFGQAETPRYWEPRMGDAVSRCPVCVVYVAYHMSISW